MSSYSRWDQKPALGRRGMVLAVVIPVLVAASAFGALRLFASEEPDLRGATVLLPTSEWIPGQDGAQALIQGALALDEDNCVYLELDQGRTYVVWPAGWRATREGADLTLYDADGDVVGHDGDMVSTGGAYVSAASYAGESCLPEEGEVAEVQGEVVNADQ